MRTRCLCCAACFASRDKQRHSVEERKAAIRATAAPSSTLLSPAPARQEGSAMNHVVRAVSRGRCAQNARYNAPRAGTLASHAAPMLLPNRRYEMVCLSRHVTPFIYHRVYSILGVAMPHDACSPNHAARKSPRDAKVCAQRTANERNAEPRTVRTAQYGIADEPRQRMYGGGTLAQPANTLFRRRYARYTRVDLI